MAPGTFGNSIGGSWLLFKTWSNGRCVGLAAAVWLAIRLILRHSFGSQMTRPDYATRPKLAKSRDFQNGINDERVARVAGQHRTLGCVITIGAGMYEPGHAIRTDTAPIGFKIGELDGRDSERARRLVAVVDAVAGTRLTTNLFGERWSKLAVNCMANPLAGLSGYGSGEVYVQPLSRRLAIRIGAEVIQVGRAAGHVIEPIYGIAAQRFVDAAAGQGQAALEAELLALGQGRTAGRPSFLQDVMRGRRTEINELNGLVVAEGQRLGVPTPVNQAVVNEVLRHGVGTLQPSPQNLEPLASLVS